MITSFTGDVTAAADSAEDDAAVASSTTTDDELSDSGIDAPMMSIIGANPTSRNNQQGLLPDHTYFPFTGDVTAAADSAEDAVAAASSTATIDKLEQWLHNQIWLFDSKMDAHDSIMPITRDNLTGHSNQQDLPDHSDSFFNSEVTASSDSVEESVPAASSRTTDEELEQRKYDHISLSALAEHDSIMSVNRANPTNHSLRRDATERSNLQMDAKESRSHQSLQRNVTGRMADIGNKDIDLEMKIQDGDTYAMGLKGARTLLLSRRNGGAIAYAKGIPILDPDDHSLVTVSLTHGENCVSFAIGKSDAWFYGFMNEDGQWFEFKGNANKNNPAVKKIHNSALLNVLGNYKHLESIAKIKRGRVKISPSKMREYVQTLAKFQGTYDGNELVGKVNASVAEALIGCIIFVSEGARFGPIEEHIKNCMVGDFGSFMLANDDINKAVKNIASDYDAVELTKDWLKLSKALLKLEIEPEDHLARAAVAFLKLAKSS